MAKTTHIVILDDSRVEKCYAGCGVDWSKEEELERARENIKARFHADILLEYLDLAQPQINEKFSSVLKKARTAELLYPLLVINEDIRISGNFDFRMLVDMIAAAQELGIV